MANYHASARSNYFEVRDNVAFEAWVETLPGVITRTDRQGRYTLLVEDGDCGGWPGFRFDESTGEEQEIDLPGELCEHLAEDSVCVLQEVGCEKLRYLVGEAVAVNHHGEVIRLSLEDIFDRIAAAGWSGSATRCSY